MSDATETQAKTDLESKSNLSFILNKPHDVSFAERPVPKLKSEHDVLVAVKYTGICGSDVHYWEHGAIGHFVVKDPMVLGHESAGTVVEVGSAVKGLSVGDRVALEPGYPCRRCANCLSGRYNLCPDMAFAATPPYDGTLTGFWTAPADFCYRLPDGVSLREGALIEPLAVAVHITRQARVRPGQSVVVMGAGPVGLLCAAVARAFGASTVVSVDILPERLEFAAALAATHTYVSQRVGPEENARNIRELAGLPDGADAVIDASGAEPSIQASLHAVRVGGTYVQGGMGRADITFPIMAFCIKEVTARGSFRYAAGDYRLAIQLVADGKVDVKRLITTTVPFEQAEVAFERVKRGDGIKILIAGPNEKVEEEKSAPAKKEEGGEATDAGKGAQGEGDKAKDVGKDAQEEGDKAKDAGKGAQEEGDKAKDAGKGAQEEGDKAKDAGKGAQEEGDKAKDAGKGAQEEEGTSAAQEGTGNTQEVTIQEPAKDAQETEAGS